MKQPKPDAPDPGQPEPLRKFVDLLAMTNDERLRQQLRLLDGLLARAVSSGKFTEALAIEKRADELLRRRPKAE